MGIFTTQSLLRIAVFALIVALGSAGLSPVDAGRRPDCWMTGGGSIFNMVNYGGDATLNPPGRLTHGFVVHCTPRRSDNLQINWKDAAGNEHHWHMTSLDSAICIDDANITPNPPDATFDTFIGQGTGRFDGQPGYTARFIFTDGGEVGGCVRDTAVIEITSPGGETILSISGDVDCGNHQAHSN